MVTAFQFHISCCTDRLNAPLILKHVKAAAAAVLLYFVTHVMHLYCLNNTEIKMYATYFKFKQNQFVSLTSCHEVNV